MVVGRLWNFSLPLINIYLSYPNTAVLPKLPQNYQIASATVDEAYSYVIVTSQLSSGYTDQGRVEFKVPFLENESLIGNIANSYIKGKRANGVTPLQLTTTAFG